MKYTLLLKSHTLGTPDFEDTIEAASKEDAVLVWYKQLKEWGWDYDTLYQYAMTDDISAYLSNGGTIADLPRGEVNL